MGPALLLSLPCPVFSTIHREENERMCSINVEALPLYLSIAVPKISQSPWSRMRPARPDHCTRVGIKRLSATEKQKKGHRSRWPASSLLAVLSETYPVLLKMISMKKQTGHQHREGVQHK